MDINHISFLDSFTNRFIKESIYLLITNKNINRYVKKTKYLIEIYRNKQIFINLTLYSRAFINNIIFDKYDNAFNSKYDYCRKIDNLQILSNIIREIYIFNNLINDQLIKNNIKPKNINKFYKDINKIYEIFSEKIIYNKNENLNINDKINRIKHFCSSNYY